MGERLSLDQKLLLVDLDDLGETGGTCYELGVSTNTMLSLSRRGYVERCYWGGKESTSPFRLTASGRALLRSSTEEER